MNLQGRNTGSNMHYAEIVQKGLLRGTLASACIIDEGEHVGRVAVGSTECGLDASKGGIREYRCPLDNLS